MKTLVSAAATFALLAGISVASAQVGGMPAGTGPDSNVQDQRAAGLRVAASQRSSDTSGGTGNKDRRRMPPGSPRGLPLTNWHHRAVLTPCVTLVSRHRRGTSNVGGKKV